MTGVGKNNPPKKAIPIPINTISTGFFMFNMIQELFSMKFSSWL